MAMLHERTLLCWRFDAAGSAFRYFDRSVIPAMEFGVNHFTSLVLHLRSCGAGHIYGVTLLNSDIRSAS